MIYQVNEGSLEYSLEKKDTSVNKDLQDFFNVTGCPEVIYVKSVNANPELNHTSVNIAKILKSFAESYTEKIIVCSISKKDYELKYGEKSATMQLINMRNILNVAGYTSIHHYLPDDDLTLYVAESVKAAEILDFFRYEDAAFAVGEIFNVAEKEAAFKFCDLVSKDKPHYLETVRNTIDEYLKSGRNESVHKVNAF